MGDFVKPKALREGDTVGIVAPSDWFSRKHFDEGVRLVKSWGLRVKFGKHIFERVDDFMAGTSEARKEDLRAMIFDDEIKAIWAAEGGYAAVDIRQALGGEEEISFLKKKPKWLIGYSDVGILTNTLMAGGIVSIYGPNIRGLTYWKKESWVWLRDMLWGKKFFFPEGDVWVGGEARGRLLATNLDSLAASLGTKYDPILNGEGDLILAVEDWKYSLSNVQRQFEAIFDHMRFDRIKGIVLGRFSLPYEISYPKWAKKVDFFGLVRDKLLERTEIPLVFAPFFGHPSYWYYRQGWGKENSLAMPNGLKVSLLASGKAVLSCLEKITA